MKYREVLLEANAGYEVDKAERATKKVKAKLKEIAESEATTERLKEELEKLLDEEVKAKTGSEGIWNSLSIGGPIIAENCSWSLGNARYMGDDR